MTIRPVFLEAPLVRAVFALARKAGGEARLVGGSVRDWYLAGCPADWSAGDIDIAMSLAITDFAAAARKAGLGVYETGLAYGTVTVCADGASAQVTQLRVDADQDGRHARISLTESWHTDASRRDFTVNALYLDEHANLFDPLDALADLRAGRLCFIGRAADRLKEDYLRLVRGLRFLSCYPQFHMATDELAALQAAKGHLASLSGERIRAEFEKLAGGHNALAVIGLMQEMGIDEALFDWPFVLNASQRAALGPVWPVASFIDRLAVLFGDEGRGAAARRLRLGRSDQRYLSGLARKGPRMRAPALGGPHWQQEAFRLGRGAVFAYLKALTDAEITPDAERLRHIAGFQAPPCPVNGDDIKARFNLEGRAVGEMLNRLSQRWAESNFTLDRDALLNTQEHS